MAEGEGGWWGGWLQQGFQAVKDKSSEAYEFIKRDLTEFSTVVQHDTACSIVATASAVRSKLAVEGSTETTEKVKRSLSNLLGVITDTLAPPPDKTIDCDVITLMATPAGTTEVYDSTKARLYSLQADPATYCNEPDGPPEQFEAWLQGFSLEEKKGEISELLVNSPSIRSLYTKMVRKRRRVALKQRAEQVTHSEALGWEEEEEEGVSVFWVEVWRSTPQLNVCRLHLAHQTPPPPDIAPKPKPRPPSAPLGQLRERHPAHPAGGESGGVLGRWVTGGGGGGHGSPRGADARDGRGQPGGAGGPPRTDTVKEEAAQDLRVFELNSDSGKSTPSNNGKKGSSTDISEDWEKDFDLDMTEEEVQIALSKVNATGPLEDDDWEAWD
ncbi:hypothetical protein ANANG_G00003820 [Anguilla anguilla]|uniref:BSD domain-containing protein n=1 Tax=Anguilla anguilla TaxID=7936 RepID=A0A9D3MXL7_ANGAN|nr:hypothetical protein ANANG_G00003820 [Anguilla anguilla]